MKKAGNGDEMFMSLIKFKDEMKNNIKTIDGLTDFP